MTKEKVKILLADDSKVVRVGATKILKDAFDLVLAVDGEEAWQKICDDPAIRIVFTDIGMPNLDGYGLIERIRQSEDEGIRNQPVIVITGASEDEDVKRRVLELGATDFITKPFTSTEIIARAEAHINYRRDNEELKKNVEIDLLTSTLNKPGFDRQLEKDIAFVNRHTENMALIKFELNDFKALFQRLGKSAENKLIKQVATTLLKSVRKEDSVGRIGEAQFVAALPMAKSEGVVLLAKRLCAMVSSCSFKIGEETVSISMSAGVATALKGTNVTHKNLEKAAERALELAKKMGSGQVQIIKLQSKQPEKPQAYISVDNILESLSTGKTEVSDKQLDALITKLQPLFKLMSDKQKLKLIKGSTKK